MKIKNKFIMIILLIAIIAGITFYCNLQKMSSSNNINNDETIATNEIVSEEVANYDTKNLNEFINNDEIVEMNLYVAFRQYDNIQDKKSIMEIVKYLRSLKVEKVNQRPSSDTPENVVCFTDKSGKKYSLSFNDDIIAIVEVDNTFIGNVGDFYKFNGFDPKELRKICEGLGLEDSFMKSKS